MTPKVCDKHRGNPARVYHACIGCELDYLHAQIAALTADRAAMLGEAAEPSVSSMSRAVDEIRENMDYVGCDNVTALEMCDEIDRLTADLKLANAKAAYWEHDADCCGGCSECLRLGRELDAAEKVRRA